MTDIVVEWKKNCFGAGWCFKSGSTIRDLIIPWHIYLQAPSHLRHLWAIRRFQRIATLKNFRDGWMQSSGGSDTRPTRFLLKFPAGVWNVPWELLVGEVDPSRQKKISIVRGLVSEPANGLPSRFDRPMSVLMIHGDDGSQTGRNRLDLKRESDLILKIHDSLPFSHRRTILRPKVCKPTRAEFTALLEEAPDAIFFSGHGSCNPPKFFLANGEGLTPEAIANEISKSPARPLFVAFWACDTARNKKDSRDAPGPLFYTSLLDCGVASILAMQAPVTDRGATLLAQEVFQSLAAGDALDVATAIGRSVLIEAAKIAGGDSLDWACPVVWSSGLSPAHLKWNAPGSDLAQLQTASRRARLNRDGRVFFPPNDAEISTARAWTTSRLTWVKALDTVAHKESWIRALLAFQVLVPSYVVAIELGSTCADVSKALMTWAEELQQTLEPGDASGTDFRSILELIRRQPEYGWKRLCAQPNIVVSLWMPPSYRADTWFWNPFLAGRTAAIVMSEKIDSGVATDGWSVELMGAQIDLATLEAAFAAEPVLCGTLALLGMPVPLTSFEAIGAVLDQKPQLSALIVTTQANEVTIVAPAAQFFLAKLSEEIRKDAHWACMQVLSHRSFAGRLLPSIREHRLTHCLGAGENDAAVEEASALLVRYRELDRPIAALAVMRRIGRLWSELPANLLLVPAWANTMLGDIEQAIFWLDRCTPDSSLEVAWRHGLRAELYKAEGAKEAALNEIDAAIGALRTVPQSSPIDPFVERRLRAYRQDRARILHYLFYQIDRARREYEKLLDEWVGHEDAFLDVAVVLRNYSECVRNGHQPGDKQWQLASEMLERAESLLEQNRDHPIAAEIKYEMARIAIFEEAPDAPDKLIGARDAAAATGHLMLVAVSSARYFWEFEEFDADKWRNIEAHLSAFPRHGWAVRTLVDGRLRAAKRMSDAALARQSVLSAIENLRENPSFDAGSDRFRIAASAAGHDLLAENLTDATQWVQFLNLDWSGDWLDENGFRSPDDVWREVA